MIVLEWKYGTMISNEVRVNRLLCTGHLLPTRMLEVGKVNASVVDNPVPYEVYHQDEHRVEGVKEQIEKKMR